MNITMRVRGKKYINLLLFYFSMIQNKIKSFKFDYFDHDYYNNDDDDDRNNKNKFLFLFQLYTHIYNIFDLNISTNKNK